MNPARRSPRTPEILIVDDDPLVVQVIAKALAGLGRLRFATGGEEALRLARQSPPDLVLLDAQMPGVDGYAVCAEIRHTPTLSDIPVVFVTAHAEPVFEVGGFRAGASDFIAKPVNPALLVERVRAQLRVKAMADELRRVSATDALTGVGNRLAFDLALAREWQRALREHTPISLLICDVDHFKRYNDALGHPAGDEALRRVALTLEACCQRPADTVARFGGEEFALLLPQTAREGAEHMAWRVLRAMETLALPHPDSPTAALLTLSTGMSTFDLHSIAWRGAARPRSRQLVVAADRGLYQAKERGRSRACAAPFDAAASAFDDTPSAPLPLTPSWQGPDWSHDARL